ncbi:MAG TPA: histidine kinase [Thermoclostridium sp.]
MADRSWKVSVLARLIISFIIILIPIYGLGIFIYNSGLVILRRELSNSMISQVSYYLDNLENEIQRIQMLQYELLNDTDINRMATISQALTNIESRDSLLRIRNRLFAVKNSSRYIKSSTVLIPDAGKEITNASVSGLSSEKFDKMKAISRNADTTIIHADNSMYLMVPYPYSYITERDPIFLIVSELSREEFEIALKAMVNSPEEGVAIYNTQSGSIIATNYNYIFHEEIRRQIFDGSDTLTENAKIVSIDGTKFLVAYKTSDYFESILYKYVPENAVFEPLNNFRVWFAVFSVLSLTVVIVYSIYVYKFIHKPLSRLVYSFREVKKGNFDINIEHEVDDEFRFIYRNFNSMVRDLKSLIEQTYTQKLLVQKANMKQLQSQINPHFLYNSFFILNTMARTGDYENLEKFTEQLGRYFQFITRSAADEVTLQKEVEHARVYTDIQALRFSNRVKVTFDELPDEFSNIMVPRLILQPIIENAFEHGLSMIKSNGFLAISFERVEDELHIIVENNGEDISEENLDILQGKLSSKNDGNEEVTALQNINQRLKLKFGQEYGVTVDKGSRGGFKVTISIPYRDYVN